MEINLDEDQKRIVNWRTNSGGLATIIGPPGTGKTTLSAMLAVLWTLNQTANKVLLVAYTNAAADEFGWEICNIIGIRAARELCLRTGNIPRVDPLLPILSNNNADEIRKHRIIICTNMSLPNLPPSISFDNQIIDEAGIERLEHALLPLYLSINPRFHPDVPEEVAARINDLSDLITECGSTATIIGDPKQSKPISPISHDYSAIQWMSKRTPTDTLHTTYRLPDPLAPFVNEYADYGGLKSAPSIAGRRLTLTETPALDYKSVIKPENVITWADVSGEERMFGASSWINDNEAKTCAKFCAEFKRVTKDKSIAVITPYTSQRALIKNYLTRLGINDVKVQTATSALGTQAHIVLASFVRNNQERNVGFVGNFENLNVTISRAQEMLLMLGNFETMVNGWTSLPSVSWHGKKSPTRKLGNLVEKYGKITSVPSTITGL